MDDEPIDCLIVGAGPAGLTAGIYLARFLMSVRLIDAGGGRAAMIPRTHNHAGYPGGIPGRELLARMREQAADYGAHVTDGRVETLARDGDSFVAGAGDVTIRARSVLLATGVVNRRPPIDDAVHDAALEKGLLRYCPVCDGYEVTDRRVGVIGTGGHGMREALFVRGYTRDVTLVAPDVCHELSDEEIATLREAGVTMADGPCGPLAIDGQQIAVPTPAGALRFDSVYPALGSDIRSELAQMVGADTSGEGCLMVDAHQRTSVPGLYAAGDVVVGLDQISHAMGAAGVAATAIRNDLAERRPLRR